MGILDELIQCQGQFNDAHGDRYRLAALEIDRLLAAFTQIVCTDKIEDARGIAQRAINGAR